MHLKRRFILASWLAVTVSLSSAALLDDLSKDTPFLPKDRDQPMAAPTENAVVEFRGLMTTQQGPTFGLYDRTKNLSAWVRQGETGGDFVVQSYDPAAERLTILYQGQKLTLSLASSKVGLAAATPVPPPPPMGMPVQPPGVIGGNPQQPISPSENASRLAAVAAEVRRRRALRQGLPAPMPQPSLPQQLPPPVPNPVQPTPPNPEPNPAINPPLPEGLPPGLPGTSSGLLPVRPRRFDDARVAPALTYAPTVPILVVGGAERAGSVS